ncbi:pseudouridine synthase, partial [Streptomyces europaeiscabiei]|uniref:pseudouridine synthase n=1 Tax=Streptomyces europaeiscabiei TaxID=146819 RepID=UPI0038F81A3B
ALDPRGLEAVTDFTVLEQRGGLDLVEARPKTGRTHQVRLHAQRMGMPILGDRLYGGAPAARLFLHAHRLTLRKPASGDPL